jgi:hypothetical protein
MSKQLDRQTAGRFVLSLLVFSLATLTSGSLRAQNAAAYEYMTASSPLKNGWMVTSQTIPGRPISTVVTPGPVNGSGTSVTLTPTSMQTPGSTVTTTPAYPTAYSPAATPATGGSWVWVPNNGMGMTGGGVPVVTQPTLGITSNNSFKPPVAAAPANCQCQPNGVVATVPPYTTGVPTIPFAAPAPLPVTVPTSYTTSASGSATAAPGAAAPAGGSPTTVYYPYLTGNFQPIVATQNMPPGTYLGRGLIGQPTAYVDGQPVRNLFRYIFP